eukprot:298847-Alexandrium_andersonii.AAC.1
MAWNIAFRLRGWLASFRTRTASSSASFATMGSQGSHTSRCPTSQVAQPSCGQPTSWQQTVSAAGVASSPGAGS